MGKPVNKIRRRLLIGGAVAAPLLGLAIARPGDNGGQHNAYFKGLQNSLQQAGLFKPTLVIDKAKLDHNIDRLLHHLPANKAFRAVAKSLPSLPLLQYVMQRTGSKRLMAFHQPFLNQLVQTIPDADVLLGKPMPVGAAERFYATAGGAFDPSRQLTWLVDSLPRLQRYAELANGNYGTIRVVLELDIGLHRGGFVQPQDTAEAIRQLQAHPKMQFAGFMGYEPHIVKIPGVLGGLEGAKADALAAYQTHVDAAIEVLGSQYQPDQLILNLGGSQTYQLYDEHVVANELAMGSGLVKPTDFDVDTLDDHQPATFIATPVLKTAGETQIPGIEFASGLLNWYDPNAAQSFFIYGGYWKAQFASPPGVQDNGLYGNSTNQAMVNGSSSVQLQENDFVFLRPTQSEFVFLQFGDIAVYDKGQIVDAWPILQN